MINLKKNSIKTVFASLLLAFCTTNASKAYTIQSQADVPFSEIEKQVINPEQTINVVANNDREAYNMAYELRKIPFLSQIHIVLELGDEITTIPTNLYTALRDVRYLTIESKNLKEFAGEFPNLEVLTIEKDIFSRTEEEFGCYSETRVSCDLEIFRGNYPNLRKLNLSDNKLKAFECECPRLLELDLGRNQLEVFDGNYPELGTLNLYGNQIRKIKGFFPKLKSLDLRFNKLKSFDLDLTMIVDLDLSYNQLKRFKNKYPTLKDLDITGNKLKNFRGDIQS